MGTAFCQSLRLLTLEKPCSLPYSVLWFLSTMDISFLCCVPEGSLAAVSKRRAAAAPAMAIKVWESTDITPCRSSFHRSSIRSNSSNRSGPHPGSSPGQALFPPPRRGGRLRKGIERLEQLERFEPILSLSTLDVFN